MNETQDDDVVVATKSQQLLQKTTSIDLDYYTYQKIYNFLNRKYPNQNLDSEAKLKEINYLFSIGLDRAERELECSILIGEKKPRKDEMIKLGRIAQVLRAHTDYPNIKAPYIRNVINKVMPLADKRTSKKYLNCVISYIGQAGELGITDVSPFVEKIPNEFLNTTSSTSSSDD